MYDSASAAAVCLQNKGKKSTAFSVYVSGKNLVSQDLLAVFV